jgi:hypothetical protein
MSSVYSVTYVPERTRIHFPQNQYNRSWFLFVPWASALDISADILEPAMNGLRSAMDTPTWFKKYLRELVLVLFSLIIVAPMLYFGRPLHVLTPDIKYAKAKVLQLDIHHLYTDPVTGYDTFHPPYYYLVLAAGKEAGLSVDASLILMAVFNVFLIIFLSYAVL